MTNFEQYCILGELSLDGRVKGVCGVLSMVLAARDQGLKQVIVPWGNRREAAVVKDMHVFPVKTLQEAIKHLWKGRGGNAFVLEPEDLSSDLNKGALNYSEVKGQDFAKRAMEIAAAGSHNLLMIGPPGSGKSMLAKRFSTILPLMDLEEALVASKIHSVMGLLPKSGELLQQRPFRSPHHSVSDIGLVGGGRIPQPGEISLAHQGVLFLDELPEFQRSVLEVLRQPLEDDQVTISRAAGSTCFPAQFILLAAMNPCPCGFLTDETKSCHCTASQIHKYRAKISGPLLDRIDLHIEVPAIRYDDIASTEYAESSETMAERVLRVRDLQRDRFADSFKKVNGRMSDADMKCFCACVEGTESLLRSIIDEMGFSARAYGKILKVSRTIADMAGKDKIHEEHILEAVQYRSLDRDILSDILV